MVCSIQIGWQHLTAGSREGGLWPPFSGGDGWTGGQHQYTDNKTKWTPPNTPPIQPINDTHVRNAQRQLEENYQRNVFRQSSTNKLALYSVQWTY